MTGTGKSITVKEWFANKIANEVGRNINMCDVFGILKETEKAVYAMVSLGNKSRKTMWIPKSVLIEEQIGEDGQGRFHYETRKFETYEEAVEEFKSFWEMFA